MLESARALSGLGWRVKLLDQWCDRIVEGDVVHVFGLSRAALELAAAARVRKASVVVSPIIWYEPWSLLGACPDWKLRVKQMAGYVCRRTRLVLADWKAALLQCADAVLPNSEAEARQLRACFRVDPEKITVVPNGVDPTWLSPPPRPWSERDGILCVGRIEPRKNQLALVRALQGTGLRLTLAGRVVPGEEGYFLECMRIGRGYVTYVGHLPHRSPQLARLYWSARVVVLPSWFETPGLAALEGAVAGANVVVPVYGCAREYFGSQAYYVHPRDVHGIRRAVVAAHRTPAPASLAELVRLRYSWSSIALQLTRVYTRVSGANRCVSPAERAA